jgi:hypothetical protein
MHKKRFVMASLTLLVVLAAVLLGFAMLSKANSSQAAQGQTSDALPYPTTGPGVPGIPAIPIHANATTANTPAFTVADVQQYVNRTGFLGGSLLPGAHLTILKIQFMTSKQASVLLQGESTGLPDDALVCYVQLHGPSALNGVGLSVPPIPGKTKGAVLTSPTADEVFDAHTGNLLVYGTP